MARKGRRCESDSGLVYKRTSRGQYRVFRRTRAAVAPYRCACEVLRRPENRRTNPVTARAADRIPPAAVTLFMSLFAAQAAVIAITPVLGEVAADFDVSTATAGQLRS